MSEVKKEGMLGAYALDFSIADRAMTLKPDVFKGASIMNNFQDNLILLTDSYKFSHYKQYPPGTEKVYSYFECRAGAEFNETVFFGLQYYLKRYFEGQVVTQEKIDQAAAFCKEHFGSDDLFNRDGWEYILREHGGKLPIVIRAVEEGAVVPVGNVLMTIENTDPKCYWLTNFLETILVQVWYGTTVATQSREMKKVILKYLEETGTPELIPFKLHDFGFRGVSSIETAGVGGAAHLVNFMGTDTVAGPLMLKEYYGAVDMPGFSIPAAEHSTMTSWRTAEGNFDEVGAYSNMLAQYPNGLVAVVSDSMDFENACEHVWGEELNRDVMGRNGTLVIRPDSGYPPLVVRRGLEILGEKFGYTKNAKGYKVLPDQVRMIQGDGIDFKMLEMILSEMKIYGWSADNIAFGSGGGLLQKLNRDTQRCAFKCSEITVNGVAQPVFKNPKTDPTKSSKSGRLKLIEVNQATDETLTEHGPWKLITISNNDPEWKKDFQSAVDWLRTVFCNGEIKTEYILEGIRERAKVGGL